MRRYTGAAGAPVRITGLVHLDLEISSLRKLIMFAIFDNLAVPPIVGKTYRSKYIESNQCKAQGLKPYNSRIIAELDPFNSPIHTIESEEDKQLRKVQMCYVQ